MRLRRLAAAIRLPVGYRRVALAGWVLYAISWITPSIDGSRIGACAFVATAQLAASMLQAGKLPQIAFGLCALFGWLANLSILLRLPAWSRALWIAAPWFPYGLALFVVPMRSSPLERAGDMLFFYPWAVGIALIHLANIAASRATASQSPVTDCPR